MQWSVVDGYTRTDAGAGADSLEDARAACPHGDDVERERARRVDDDLDARAAHRGRGRARRGLYAELVLWVHHEGREAAVPARARRREAAGHLYGAAIASDSDSIGQRRVARVPSA